MELFLISLIDHCIVVALEGKKDVTLPEAMSDEDNDQLFTLPQIESTSPTFKKILLSPFLLKKTILKFEQYDFLKDVVRNIPDKEGRDAEDVINDNNDNNNDDGGDDDGGDKSEPKEKTRKKDE